MKGHGYENLKENSGRFWAHRGLHKWNGSFLLQQACLQCSIAGILSCSLFFFVALTLQFEAQKVM